MKHMIILGCLLICSPVSGQQFTVEVMPSFTVSVDAGKTVHRSVTKTRTRYLVSEEWCTHCPAAKTRFIQLGWPAKNVITNAECFRRFGFRVPHVPYEFEEPETSQSQQTAGASFCNCSAACVCGCQSGGVCKCGQTTWQVQQYKTQRDPSKRYATWGGTSYDMETWSRHCSMRNCQMCKYLDNAQAVYFASSIQVQAEAPSPQSSSPEDVVLEAIAIMGLKPDDVLAELGCGDAMTAIRIAQATGCKVVGVEIDPVKAAEALKNIDEHGLSHRITLVAGDVRNFDPSSYGATAIYAYLYPELLEEIKPQLACGRITVCPGHRVDGLGFQLVGQCWVRKS